MLLSCSVAGACRRLFGSPLMCFVTLLVALLCSATARAEEFGGWSFTAPSNANRAQAFDYLQFSQVKGRTFCQFSLFPARVPTADHVAFEWQVVVERNFTVQGNSKTTSFTSQRGIPVVVRSASVVEKKNGNPFAFALYVLQPQGAAGSLLVAATDEATLATCPVSEFLDSLSFVSLPAAAGAAQAPAAGTAPAKTGSAGKGQAEASISGAWGTSSGNPTLRSGTGSVLRRQYIFKPDGTYTYFSELFDGVNTWIHVRESGHYEVSGDRLTISPSASTISSRDWNAVRSTKTQPLERVTYAFKKHYFSGLREWSLVLTPPNPTERDGPFAANALFPNSYLLSNTFKPEWKWP